MELVEGEGLDEVIARGPVPMDEAIPIALQIAEALETAHEAGIVHRDLKPANVKIRPDGTVKVLDFGLAKAWEEGEGTDLSLSPTMTRHATAAGVILGTAAYMAPEQARGKPVDRRADIWAFGVVLWEMLTGRKLFDGDTVSDVMAAVLRDTPDLGVLPDTTPSSLRQLVDRCLRRDPRTRLQWIGDARVVLEDLRSSDHHDTAEANLGARSHRPGPLWRRALPWALLALLGLAWMGTLVSTAPEPTDSQVTVLPLDLGDDQIVMSYGASAVLSPDGRRIAWVGGSRSESWLVVRDLDSSEARRLDGTEGAHDPVFSPDGQEIAFFTPGALMKVPIRGGSPVRIAEVGLPRGVTWADGDWLIYNRDVADGLWRVSARGGEPERLSSPDEARNERSHRWPQAVRGDGGVVFLAQQLGQRYEEATIELLDLESGERTVVHRGGSYPRIGPGGELLYVRDRALWAAAFDPRAGVLAGQPVRVVDEVAYSAWSGGAQVALADDGTLVYSTGRSAEAVELSWYDPRTGTFERIAGEPGFFYTPALAPDGRSLAVQVYTGGRSDIWIFDLVDGSRRRLTFGGRDEYPVWSHDGSTLAFSRMVEGAGRVVASVRADGVGEPRQIASSRNQRYPTSWSSTGALLFTELAPDSYADIWVTWPDDPSRPAELFLGTAANESNGLFSPDGRWVLYESDESGANEIYVRAFTGSGGRWQVSADGGTRPQWSTDGRAIYYWSRAGLNLREVGTDGDAIRLGRLSVSTVETPVLRTEDSGYVVARDGRLLLFPFAGEAGQRPRTSLVLAWGRELTRLLEGNES